MLRLGTRSSQRSVPEPEVAQAQGEAPRRDVQPHPGELGRVRDSLGERDRSVAAEDQVGAFQEDDRE